jgi:hypothetical protein
VVLDGRHEVARMGPHGDWLKWEKQCTAR